MTLTSPRSATATRKPQGGFTLIELMIVVAVIGILGALAFPSYQESVAKSRRADAQRALMEAEQYMRRYYSARDSFAGTFLPSSVSTSPRADAGPAAYNIQLIEGVTVVGTGPTDLSTAVSTYTLRATRTGSMVADRCGDLSVTNTGVKTLSNNASGTTLADCFKAS